MKQLYSTAKQKGVALSKSILQIVLQKSAQELRHAQENFKLVQKLPVETFVPRGTAEKEDQQLQSEDLEEISSMGAAAVAGYAGPTGKPKRKRKLKENEVNEAINYLLQKLGV